MNLSLEFSPLVVLTLFMVLSAGCTSSVMGPPYPSYGKSLDQICEEMRTNSSGWIIINEVNDIQTGEFFLVTAKTNLAAGTDVIVQTWPITANPVNRSDASGDAGVGFHTDVMKGKTGENVITGVIDSRKFRPEPYVIAISNDSAGVSGCTWYNVSTAHEERPTAFLPVTSPAPQCPKEDPGLYIKINPIPNHHLGDSFTIDGTTNLDAGELITIWIGQQSYHTCPRSRAGSCNDSVEPCCDGISRTVPVVSGRCNINTWLLSLNTSQHDFRPDDLYDISATGRNYQVEKYRNFTVTAPL